jgi:predicted unusual protein kinase regulating ubiquinone biosynthesis (AarF/ABC1/UbiB family)
VTDIPQRRGARTARLASLPLGAAGRSAVGFGRRLAGQSADTVNAEIQARTAEQIFAVLGELKGGAMKFGQALSVFEAALPEEAAAPYREALTKLQEAAPPMSGDTMRRVLDEQFGRSWRSRFQDFDEVPAAAASIGQVHKATWKDGRTVAVKIQYPGAGPALMADFATMSRLARLFGRLSPGIDVKPLLAELGDRIAEELDYTLEADAQRAFAAAYDGDEDILVPKVVASAPKVVVSDWIDGTPLAHVIADGTKDQRDRAGYLLALLHFGAPQRAHMLHADPHPGNFRIMPDGRLGLIDYGAVSRMPNGTPRTVDGDTEAMMRLMTREKFVRPGVKAEAEAIMAYLRPILDPLAVPEFTFTREWMRGQAARIGDPRSEEARVGRALNLPPEYLLMHRVTLGSLGILCQLGSTAPYRGIAEQWYPGFADPDATG